jgi:hypothetical protein
MISTRAYAAKRANATEKLVLIQTNRRRSCVHMMWQLEIHLRRNLSLRYPPGSRGTRARRSSPWCQDMKLWVVLPKLHQVSQNLKLAT